MFFLIKLVVIATLTSECWSQNTVTISVEEGQVRGLVTATTTTSKTTYYSFKNIPYAQPPVGNLRFQPPKPVEPWSGVVDAVYQRNKCFQVTTDEADESEDCLIINVYTPEINCTEATLPVMFYIHGGGFVEGYGWVGEQFFIDNNIIVASIQYRLGPFGFFSTGDTVIPGNNGLKDQVLALQWAQKNIHHFCGDPKQVTIFGQSAGGASVSYQLLSPKSAGLYKAAICESGSALSPWAYQRDQTSITYATAAIINPEFSTNRNSTALLEYLLTVDAKDIDAASATFTAQGTVENLQILQGFYYAPVIEVEHDDAFITEPMYESFESGNFNKVPVLIGITAEEYDGWFNSTVMKYVADSFTANTSLFIPNDMHLTLENATEAGNEVRKFYNIYTTDNTFTERVEADSTIFFSDTSFGRSVFKQAELQSQYCHVYCYKFSYDGIMGDYDGVLDGTGNVRHGEELHYIFNAVVHGNLDNTNLSNFPEDDVQTHYRLVRLWSNFAKYNNPTPEKDELLQNLIWPKVSSNPIEYMDINATLTVGTGPKGPMYEFWTSLYDKYGVRPFDSY